MSGIWANTYFRLFPAVAGNTQTQLLAKSSTLNKFHKETTDAEGMQIKMPVYFPVSSVHNWNLI